jgi:hypothetical protein
MDQGLTRLLGILNCGGVTSASAAMTERVMFVMCGLGAYQQTTACSTFLEAFQVAGLHPLSLEIVLKRPEVRRSAWAVLQARHPDRAFTGSQELTSDAWGARVRECGGREGLVAGHAKAITVRRLTWSLVGTDSLMQRRSEPSMPMRGPRSRGDRHIDAGS